MELTGAGGADTVRCMDAHLLGLGIRISGPASVGMPGLAVSFADRQQETAYHDRRSRRFQS